MRCYFEKSFAKTDFLCKFHGPQYVPYLRRKTGGKIVWYLLEGVLLLDSWRPSRRGSSLLALRKREMQNYPNDRWESHPNASS